MRRYSAWENWYTNLMLVRMLHVMFALHYLSCVPYMNRIHRNQHQVNPARGFLFLILKKITALKTETWAVLKNIFCCFFTYIIYLFSSCILGICFILIAGKNEQMFIIHKNVCFYCFLKIHCVVKKVHVPLHFCNFS